MHRIWDDYKAGKITSKKAFDLIRVKLETASKEETKNLIALSEKILDSDVPMIETNTEIDEAWWKQHHKEEE